jgi:nitroreductase
MITLNEALAGRRTCGAFKPDPIPDEVINAAIDAAQWAPNHKRTWPWRFVVAGPQTRAALGDLAVAGRRAAGVDDGAALLAARRPFDTPGALIAVAQVLDDDPFRRREDYASCAIAVQHLMLSLFAQGYGSKWGTGPLTRHPAALALLGLDPIAHDVTGFVFAGVTDRVPEAPERPPRDAVTSRLP